MTSTDVFAIALLACASFLVGYIVQLGRSVVSIRETLKSIDQRLEQLTPHTTVPVTNPEHPAD